MPTDAPKILIAGVGNELRQDDAFGVLLAAKLQAECTFPDTVKIMEMGSAGIHMVQQLFDHYDVILILDIVKWGGDAGTIHFKEVDIKDITTLPKDEQNAFLADMHYINPVKALMMAKAMKLLPPLVLFLGCESEEHEEMGIGISKAVNDSMTQACSIVKDWVTNYCNQKSIPVENFVP